jgi:predicted glycosyltransferase
MKQVNFYYQVKPFIPRSLQIFLRQRIAAAKLKSNKNIWPIDHYADIKPSDWKGWPEKKKFALVFQHDVDTIYGLRNCASLMDLDLQMGFLSSFNFVPEDYSPLPTLLKNLREAGFEIGVHGLKHDGKLFLDKTAFCKNAPRINYYLKKWGALGFTSPSMLRNLAWMAELDIEHGCSTFDTDPFEPQSEGVGTIFPFFATNQSKTKTYVELPYTIPQDHTLFVILKNSDIRIWKEKLDWIAEKGGLALLNTHPDYMNFSDTPCAAEEYTIRFYKEFLQYIKDKYSGQYWNVLPRDLASFWNATGLSKENRTIPLSPKWKPLEEDCLREQDRLFHNHRAKIWIDLDNTPHVPFFIPIIRELERRGHQVILSARDAFQVCELAGKKNLSFTKIGRHYGKNAIKKIFGLFWRAGQLAPFFVRHKPGLALSHGSRSQFLLANLLRIPTILMIDYEHSRTIRPALPRWMIVPEAIFGEKLPLKPKQVRYYRGIKEDVYAPEFEPDPSLCAELGLRPEEIVVTVRPPATEAHYRNPESDKLLLELMSIIVSSPGIRAVLLPRNHAQEQALKKNRPEWFAENKTIVPPGVVDGLNLLWFSDLVVSGGGTMNREAAALGVPVYSIFRGKTGAVDHLLEKEGRLTMIHNPEEVHSKIRFVRREKSRTPDQQSRKALEDIVNYIEEIIWIASVRRLVRLNVDPVRSFSGN